MGVGGLNIWGGGCKLPVRMSKEIGETNQGIPKLYDTFLSHIGEDLRAKLESFINAWPTAQEFSLHMLAI